MTDLPYPPPHQDEPITLREAAETFFRGRIKVATLRAERKRGNLRTFKIGRQEFTTNAFLREMIRCRVARQAQGSGSINGAAPGSSETDRVSSARAAALRIANELKRSSKPTSGKSSRLKLVTIP